MTDEIEYLSAIEEGQVHHRPGERPADKKGKLTDELVSCRTRASSS